MRKGNPQPLTPELLAQVDALAAMPDESIDTSDMPEITDWSKAVRGAFYRPVKRQVTVRFDADVIEWFRKNGNGERGYQTRMNEALRAYMLEHISQS